MSSRRLLNTGVSLLALGLASTIHISPAQAQCTWSGGNCTISAGTYGGVSIGSAYGTLSNSGFIVDSSQGVAMTPGGSLATLLNNSGAMISGNATGLGISGGGIGTLTNTGTISGSATNAYSYGINVSSTTRSGTLASAGSVGALTNSGLITGSYSGIKISGGGIGTLTNTGAISGSGSDGYGIYLFSDIDNSTLVSPGSIGTLTNSGSITGIWKGIVIQGGTIGTLTNLAGGTISGNTGIYISSATRSGTLVSAGSIGALTNSGRITGNATGINVSGGSIGTLTNTGTISGAGFGVMVAAATGSGMLLSVGRTGMLTNSGVIGTGQIGIEVQGGDIGTLVNQAGGTISGTEAGILVKVAATSGTLVTTGSIGTLTNNGLIVANGTHAVAIGLQSGSIGSLSNTGTILGTAVGIGIAAAASSGTTFAPGSIGAIINSGLISGGAMGIANLGTIGPITNSGIITGASYAIYNAGVLGAITNSGTIAGNIYSTSDLTIAGGATGWGELDGTAGAGGTMGTITVNGGVGTLDLIAGQLWLNDNVVGNVSNTGATVRLSQAVSVSGNYTQSSGGLVIVASSTTNYGYLTVGGSASIRSTGVTLSGNGLNGGQSYTIVRPTGSGSYTDDTASVHILGLSAALSTVNDDLVVSLSGTAETYQSVGQTLGATAGQMGAALDSIYAANNASADMQTILADINAETSTAQQARSIRQLAPAQGVPGYQMAMSSAGLVSNVIGQHQHSMMAYNPDTGTADGGDADGMGNTLWGQILGGGASRSTSGDTDGYNMAQYGLAAGVDHQFSDRLLGGLALSWMRDYTHGSSGADAKSTLDSYQLTFYGTYRIGPLFFDTQAGAGYDRFQQKRNIDFLGRTASANYDGALYVLREQAGYDIPLANRIMLTPLAGLTVLRSENAGYTEYGANAANLTVNQQGATGLTHDIGARVSWSVDTALGLLKPELRAEWVHDYESSAVVTSGSLAGAAFATTASRISPNGAQLGLAATLESGHNLSLRAEYTTDLRSNYQSQVGMVKAVWGF